MFDCKSCGITKPADEYRVHKRGYRVGKCKECERAYQREWSQRDPAEYRRRKREHMARRRAANPDAVREYQRKDYLQNRDARLSAMKEYQRRRFFWLRASKLKSDVCAADLARLWKQQRGRCALTGRRLDRAAQIDHIVPRVKGGQDVISNLRWVCPEINYAKRDMTDEQLVEMCRDCMRWIGERIQMVQDIQRDREAA